MKKLLEAGQTTERVAREAAASIGRGTEQGLTAIRLEGERQRVEAERQWAEAEQERAQAVEQIRIAQERLGEAMEKSRTLATSQVREDLERMLDDLLRDVRAIGEQPGDG